MEIKLKKGIDYKTKIPSYAAFKRGAIVRIKRPSDIKKYQKSKQEYFDKLAIVIGYAIKKAGPITYAVRVMESGNEYILYNYLLVPTGKSIWLPSYEIGEDVIVKSLKIKGKWARIIDCDEAANTYTVKLNVDQQTYIVKEKDIKIPTEKDETTKSLEMEFPELEGTF